MPHRQGNFKNLIKVKCACGYEMMRQYKKGVRFVCVTCKKKEAREYIKEYHKTHRISVKD